MPIKVWVLADSRNGYFHTLQVYTGKEGNGEKQLGQRVVKDLMHLLKGKNHHVFFDNFISEELLQDLLKDDILDIQADLVSIVSTIVCVCVCSCVCMSVINYNLFRGESVTVQKGKVSVSAWMDRKVVMVMSSNCQPDGVGTILRRQQDGSRIPVTCPESIICYNEHMGGVDCGDQLHGYYSCRTKSRKFYKYIFTFLLDVAITKCIHSHEALLSHMSLCQYQELPSSAGKGVDG